MATRVTLHYCTGCNWLLRSSWMAQELLTTFNGMIDELTLKPGDGGIFEVWVNDTRIWSRKEQGGFPEIKQLKQLVRDQIAPEHSLGHTDAHAPQSGANT
ncbi:MAG: SelT/SelW/SelH family protein [Gammaproteobacteria bacterium]|uniref:Rdx family protein n=1 Tax=Marinobacter litoralis TaxID=187981 RepID=A0A3M2RJS9_9GAMM|nr:SelT/SelW/SelH family protein [Marinobacter litoralis]MBR9869859.1 SelT/SelW/SelH family protein [Gammaproteobacteria bacterium]RMJ05577.1 Rdx family protein [Marinobacter litoralis]